MQRPDPVEYAWWLSSRAAGVVAFALIALSVILGLAMANRLVRGKAVAKLHEHLALAGLVAIAVHGITLLGDSWLNPGFKGLLVPFAMEFKPVFTGLGIVGGYLAALLGLSFYMRRRIGAKRWRKMHRATVLVYVLGVIHTLGAGTDASAPWMRAVLLATGAPIVFLFLLRVLPEEAEAKPKPARPPRPAAEERPRPVPAATPQPEAT
ncbi:MAG TPA: ferric reductase-like transmembrane domain-containing protein [Thermoleophilaceae bacterium]|jgi:sulfoxide reductase heme-binding subunit YedZ